jgi:hypothetical protein
MHAGNEANLPWRHSREAEVHLSHWTTTEQFSDAADAAAAVACATCHMADELNLPHGGHGYLGGGNDAVATVQASMHETVTLYPCMMAGQTKTYMAEYYNVCFCVTLCLLFALLPFSHLLAL